MSIPVIDIFAGPGGLGEGFSSLTENGERVFDIKLSIEKDPGAHETLRLRSFFRKFPVGQTPEDYYKILREDSWTKRKSLIDKLKDSHPDEWESAEKEAWCFELPYLEECDDKGNKKGGYTDREIKARHKEIDLRIEKALDGAKNFLLIGGPPCQAYSLVGRSRNRGISKSDHRVHLYKEYLRIIAKHHPAVFVMENVKGLLSAKVSGDSVFEFIKQDLNNPSSVFKKLKSPRYKIYSLVESANDEDDDGFPIYEKDSDFLIRAEEYGIPQKRHRVILLGIREDIKAQPVTLEKGKEPVTLEQVIGDLPKIRSGINRSFLKAEFIQGKKKRYYQNETDSEDRWKKLVNTFRKEVISWNGFAKEYSHTVIETGLNGIGSEFMDYKAPNPKTDIAKWYYDSKINGICNHQSRSHLVEDLKRYMFSSMFANTYNRFPRLHEFEEHSEELLPDHENVNSGKFADRFRVQLPDEPATTVTSHISKDGHYFIHYDPNQCRSLTVREAARIQTFPDNYLFCGARTSQYHQVGNAVQPFLARNIAQIVFKLLKKTGT